MEMELSSAKKPQKTCPVPLLLYFINSIIFLQINQDQYTGFFSFFFFQFFFNRGIVA